MFFPQSPRCLQQSHLQRLAPSIVCCASAVSACEKASAWQWALDLFEEPPGPKKSTAKGWRSWVSPHQNMKRMGKNNAEKLEMNALIIHD